MPARPIDSWQAESTTERLQKHYGLKHLRARKRGLVLTIESGPKEDTVPHFRVRRDTVHLWLLEFPARSGWERTPYRDALDNLLELVVTLFPWTVAPVHGNPRDTSDQENQQHGTWAAAAEALGCDEKTLRQDAALVDGVEE